MDCEAAAPLLPMPPPHAPKAPVRAEVAACSVAALTAAVPAAAPTCCAKGLLQEQGGAADRQWSVSSSGSRLHLLPPAKAGCQSQGVGKLCVLCRVCPSLAVVWQARALLAIRRQAGPQLRLAQPYCAQTALTAP